MFSVRFYKIVQIFFSIFFWFMTFTTDRLEKVKLVEMKIIAFHSYDNWDRERESVKKIQIIESTPSPLRWILLRMMTSHIIIIRLKEIFGFCYLICLAVILFFLFVLLHRFGTGGIRFNFHSHRIKCDCVVIWWELFWWTGKN